MERLASAGKATIILALLLIIATLYIPYTRAESSPWYIGVEVGLSHLEPETEDTSYTVTDKESNGGKIYAGFQISRRYAIEVLYASLGQAELNQNEDLSYDITGVGLNYSEYSANQKVKGFVRASYVQLENSSDALFEQSNENLFTYAAGLEYRFTDSYSLRTEYERFSRDAHFISIGISKYFGGTKPASPAPAPAALIPPKKPVITDKDSDGVLDNIDVCPDTPTGVAVDRKGCAVFQGVMPNIQFHENSTKLTEATKKTLDGIADEIKRIPTLLIEIQAHTDSSGGSEYNLWLSNQRAKEVLDYLVVKGVRKTQLKSSGYGETNPVGDNKTAQGRANNRRVEFVIIPLE